MKTLNMTLNRTNVLLILLGITLILCFIVMITDKPSTEQSTEPFDPVMDAIQNQLQSESPEQLKDTIKNLQQRLIDYGYAPDLKNYVRKTELGDKCTMATAEDRDKYIPKSDVPAPGPRIDLSQYVKKSSIPPEKVCPPAPTIDLSAYVKKSTLPPNEKCPPCISPKVKVSAGLCRECPPPPPCPAPAPCPACNCPAPAPCPTQKECKKCDEIRYIKVPAVITKTIMVDQNGNIISQKVDAGSTTPSAAGSIATTTTTPQTTVSATRAATIKPKVTESSNVPFFGLLPSTQTAEIPTTTFPMMSSTSPNTTIAQNAGPMNKNGLCASTELNSEFKSYGILGRDVSNYIY